MFNKKILLAVDGSANSMRAAEYVASMLKMCPEIKVTIIYVIPQYLPDFKSSEKITDTVQELADKAVNFAKKILASETENINTVIKKGSVAKEITDFAKKEGFNLIVMGSRGLTAVEGITLGSISHEVLTLTQIPILFVK